MNKNNAICLALLFTFAALTTAASAVGADPAASTPGAQALETKQPLLRSESFLGIHFDLHAGPDDHQMGARTTPEMVYTVIDKVQPDYIQIDCKGHPGYSSYPTKVGNPVPGFVGDPLKVWREATRARGVALFMHYSGVIDARAVALHPEWAARTASGKLGSRDRVTSVFGPYVDELMIPQLRELAGDYRVDGVWVDGDCWGVMVDYSDAAMKAWEKQTGDPTAPTDPSDPRWHRWLAFHREAYRRYLRHYVDALKSSHPEFQVISNWSFSDHMPEPVSADVAALSGDFRPDDSVNSARFAGRCIENQGMPWDLMAWSFSRKTRQQKPAVQLMQEAAIVLAQGGGFQAYFKQDREGAVRDMSEMDVMAQVAQFCRDRQAFCHRSKAVPQIALLYSTAGHYRSSNRLFHPSGSDGIPVLLKALTALLENQQAVQIVSEHHLVDKMSDWPLIVVPGWGYLEPAFRDNLAAYATSGGKLLLVGDGPAGLFSDQLKTTEGVLCIADADQSLMPAVRKLFPEPVVTVTGSNKVDVSPRKLGGRLAIHLMNTAGPHADAPVGGISQIPPVGPLTVAIRLPTDPQAIVQQPAGRSLPFTRQDDRIVVTVPQLDIYDILEVRTE